MRSTRSIAFLAILIVLAAACARTTGTGQYARTITLGPQDAGRNVRLAIGDRLVLQLGPTFPEAGIGLSWRLASYPEAVLELESQSAADGRFEFRAVASGRGEVRLAGSIPCDPAVEREPDAVGCPVGGEEPTDARGGTFPVKLFAVTVSVS